MQDGTLKMATPITPIDSARPQPQCRFTINAVLRGFPITIEGEGRAGDLKIIIERLIDSGAEPPQVASGQNVQKQNGAPLCPAHNSPMKASRKPGSYFCPRQAEDGSGYCPHKA